MGKVNALAAKKGLPKFSMSYNQLSSFDADDIQDYANEIEVAEVVHHRRNLYGKGTAPLRKHEDKPITKEHINLRSYSSIEDEWSKK
jgi:hypothetical protein